MASRRCVCTGSARRTRVRGPGGHPLLGRRRADEQQLADRDGQGHQAEDGQREVAGGRDGQRRSRRRGAPRRGPARRRRHRGASVRPAPSISAAPLPAQSTIQPASTTSPAATIQPAGRGRRRTAAPSRPVRASASRPTASRTPIRPAASDGHGQPAGSGLGRRGDVRARRATRGAAKVSRTSRTLIAIRSARRVPGAG